jgi:hypothetical protein
VVASRTAREWPRPSDCHQIGGWHWQAAPTRSAGHARYLGHWAGRRRADRRLPGLGGHRLGTVGGHCAEAGNHAMTSGPITCSPVGSSMPKRAHSRAIVLLAAHAEIRDCAVAIADDHLPARGIRARPQDRHRRRGGHRAAGMTGVVVSLLVLGDDGALAATTAGGDRGDRSRRSDQRAEQATSAAHRRTPACRSSTPAPPSTR